MRHNRQQTPLVLLVLLAAVALFPIACGDDEGGASACEGVTCGYGVCVPESDGARCECETGWGGASCLECAEGYAGDGVECLPIGDCSANPCIHGVCIEGDSGPFCQCHEGYANSTCEACGSGYAEVEGICVLVGSDPCDPNPCDEAHKTQCTPDPEGGQSGAPAAWTCSCDNGYTEVDGACV